MDADRCTVACPCHYRWRLRCLQFCERVRLYFRSSIAMNACLNSSKLIRLLPFVSIFLRAQEQARSIERPPDACAAWQGRSTGRRGPELG